MKKPFLHALVAALYIVTLVLLGKVGISILQDREDTIFIPMTMLSIFVLSAAVMGYLFLSEPLQLLIDGKKKDAIIFFAKVVGFFACFVAIFATLLFFV